MTRWRPGRSRLLRAGLLLGFLLAIGVFLRVQGLENASKWAGVGGLLVAIATLLLPRVLPPRQDGNLALGAALDTLAGQNLSTVWDLEWRRLRLHDPGPLQVSWRTDDELADHWSNIADTATPIDLAGHLAELADVFRRLPRRRLVVLGEGGQGKSVLCLHLARELLARRRAGGAVPVIVRLSSWHPGAEALEDWLVERLPIDVAPGLAASTGGVTVARAIVDADLVVPILDGLDELPEPLRAEAIARINDWTGPLVLTCRPEEFEQALGQAHDVITSAAVIRLEPLATEEVSTWLRRTSAGPARQRAKWEQVTERIGTGTSVVADALSTPLMVGLARAAYSETAADPGELLGPGYTCRVDIEQRLLEQLLPTTFRNVKSRAHDPVRVRRYLANISGYFSTEDNRLDWWRLTLALPRWRSWLVRTLLVALLPTVTLVVGYGADWSEAGLIGALFVLVALVLEPSGGLAVPQAVRPGFDRARARAAVRMLARRGLRGAAVGALIGLVSAITTAAPSVAALVGAVAAAVMFVTTAVTSVALLFVLPLTLLTVVTTPVDLARAVDPRELLRLDRFWSVVQGVLFGATVGLTVGGALVPALSLAQVLWTDATVKAGSDFDPQFLILYGIPAGLAYLLVATAWGRFCFARAWLALLGRLPWRLVRLLDDSCARGVLRPVGAGYEFRHGYVRTHLTAKLTP